MRDRRGENVILSHDRSIYAPVAPVGHKYAAIMRFAPKIGLRTKLWSWHEAASARRPSRRLPDWDALRRRVVPFQDSGIGLSRMAFRAWRRAIHAGLWMIHATVIASHAPLQPSSIGEYRRLPYTGYVLCSVVRGGSFRGAFCGDFHRKADCRIM
jgi:hypothetical protein